MGFFIQYGDELKFTNRILAVAFVVSFAVNVFLVYKIASKPVGYIDIDKIVGNVRAGYVPDNVVEVFTRYFVLLMGNISSETIRDMYQEAVYLMSPKLQAAVVDILNDEISEFSKTRGSAIRSVTHNIDIKKISEKRFSIKVVAFRDYYSYGRLTMRKAIQYRIIVGANAPVTKHNPFGMWVEDYEGPTELGTVEQYLKEEGKHA